MKILLKQDNLSLIKRWNNYYITWIIDENMNWFPAQIKITLKDKEKILTQNEIRPIFDLYLNKNTNFNSRSFNYYITNGISDYLNYKNVEFSQTDIFDVQYLINYDADIPGLLKIWKNPLFDDHKDQLYLRIYSKHPLPGWHKRRNSALCTKDVNFGQIGKAKLIYTYYKKNGYALMQPRIDYVDVDLRTLRKIINYYHSVFE